MLTLFDAFEKAAEETKHYANPDEYIIAHPENFNGRKLRKYPASVLVEATPEERLDWRDGFILVSVREAEDDGETMYDWKRDWPYPGRRWAFVR